MARVERYGVHKSIVLPLMVPVIHALFRAVVPGHVMPFGKRTVIEIEPAHPLGTDVHDNEKVPPRVPTVGDVTVGVVPGAEYATARNSRLGGSMSLTVTFVAPAGMVK